MDAAGTLGWLGVVVDSDGFVGARVGGLEDIVDWAEPVAAIGVDSPIGGVRGGSRAADIEARSFVKPRGACVFPAPPPDVYDAPSYEEANRVLVSLGMKKLSKQAWALLPKILEVAALACTDQRIFEVHPEVSFRALAGKGIVWSKKSWNGTQLRRRLLADAGIEVPDAVTGIGDAASDDLLDAAAAAWSARRKAVGTAECFPATPEVIDGRSVAIWY